MPENGYGYVELLRRSEVVARSPIESDGSFSITNLLPGKYMIRAYSGSVYTEAQVVKLTEGSSIQINMTIPFELEEDKVYNYPNPVRNGHTIIRYECNTDDHTARILILTVTGRLVKGIDNDDVSRAEAPVYKYSWDCCNEEGSKVVSGVYIYVVKVYNESGEEKKVIKKMMVIR